MSSNLHNLISILGKMKQNLGQLLFFLLSQHYQLRHYLHTRLTNTPNRLLAFLHKKWTNYLRIQKLLAHVLSYHRSTMNNLPLHSHTRLLEYINVVAFEEMLSLLLRHIRSHLRNKIYRNYLTLLIIEFLELQRQTNHLLPLLTRQLVSYLSQQNRTIFPHLHKQSITSKCEQFTSFINGSMKRCWRSVSDVTLGNVSRRYLINSVLIYSQSSAWIRLLLRVTSERNEKADAHYKLHE